MWALPAACDDNTEVSYLAFTVHRYNALWMSAASPADVALAYLEANQFQFAFRVNHGVNLILSSVLNEKNVLLWNLVNPKKAIIPYLSA